MTAALRIVSGGGGGKRNVFSINGETVDNLSIMDSPVKDTLLLTFLGPKCSLPKMLIYLEGLEVSVY